MAVRDRLEGGLEVGEGLDAVDLRGLDQRRDAAPRLAALVVTREERVFPVQGDRADQVLDAVGVDLDASVMEEGLQAVPVAVDVGELLAEAGLGGDAQALLLQPVSEGGDQGRGPRLPGRQALARRERPGCRLRRRRTRRCGAGPRPRSLSRRGRRPPSACAVHGPSNGPRGSGRRPCGTGVSAGCSRYSRRAAGCRRSRCRNVSAFCPLRSGA